MAVGPKGCRVLFFRAEEVRLLPFFHLFQQASSWVIWVADVQVLCFPSFLARRASFRFVPIVPPPPDAGELCLDLAGTGVP
eukprot:9078109-Heterocapsa_arctica.AAC.1